MVLADQIVTLAHSRTGTPVTRPRPTIAMAERR